MSGDTKEGEEKKMEGRRGKKNVRKERKEKINFKEGRSKFEKEKIYERNKEQIFGRKIQNNFFLSERNLTTFFSI